MSAIGRSKRGRFWLYTILVLVLAQCLWFGWGDLDLWVSREDLREGIRLGIRRVIQIAVQFVVPTAIILFLVREAIASRRHERA